MKALVTFPSSSFQIENPARNYLYLVGCKITQWDEFSITLSQKQILTSCNFKEFIDAVERKGGSNATEKQATVYQHIIGKMFSICPISAPLVLLQASTEATKLSKLQPRHLQAFSTTDKRLETQSAILTFLPQQAPNALFVLDITSDGATARPEDIKDPEGHIILRRYGNFIHSL